MGCLPQMLAIAYCRKQMVDGAMSNKGDWRNTFLDRKHKVMFSCQRDETTLWSIYFKEQLSISALLSDLVTLNIVLQDTACYRLHEGFHVSRINIQQMHAL